mmetsp:Transcript_21101/g.62656  ORF Transcript_21101/g.62656 Transcript_21101/m.62656 type:complete len:104 (-) Transcript_21101:16-327(-)
MSSWGAQARHELAVPAANAHHQHAVGDGRGCVVRQRGAGAGGWLVPYAFKLVDMLHDSGGKAWGWLAGGTSDLKEADAIALVLLALPTLAKAQMLSNPRVSEG